MLLALNTAPKLHYIVLDDCFFNMADGMITSVCSFDIRKCFDTISHSIFFKKMEKYGFQSKNVDWFRSFFLTRQQFVLCHNELSRKCQLEIGVPKGSVLGQILLLLYVNDINRHVYIGACNLYADATLVYCSVNYMDALQENTQKCVSSINECYDNNVMVITTSQRAGITNVHRIGVSLGSERLTQLECLDYLGVKLGSHLSWNLQVDDVCRKLVFIISRIGRLKHVLAPHVLMYICNGIVQPRLDYAIAIWGITSQHNIYKV